MKNPTKSINTVRKYHIETTKKKKKTKGEKPIDKVASVIKVENLCRRRQLNQEIQRKSRTEDTEVEKHSGVEISNTHTGTLVEKTVEKDYRMNIGTRTFIEQFQLKSKKKMFARKEHQNELNQRKTLAKKMLAARAKAQADDKEKETLSSLEQGETRVIMGKF